MGDGKHNDGKADALRRGGTLNRHAERVSDARFAEGGFFDARDLVQVKYEMLRHVRAEGASVTEAAGAFGMSRFSFYQTQAAFEETGLPGLMPKKPGPRGRHKLTPEVVAFVQEELANDPSLEVRDLPDRVRERFGLRVHRRTIERALADAKKNRGHRRSATSGRPFDKLRAGWRTDRLLRGAACVEDRQPGAGAFHPPRHGGLDGGVVGVLGGVWRGSRAWWA